MLLNAMRRRAPVCMQIDVGGRWSDCLYVSKTNGKFRWLPVRNWLLQASIGSCPQDLHVSGLRAPRLPDQRPKLAHRPSHPRCAYAHISTGSSNRSAPSSNWGCRSAPARSHPVMLLCSRAACSVRLVSPFSLGSRCYCYSLSRLYRSPDDARKQHIRREFRGRILVRAGTLGPELECE